MVALIALGLIALVPLVSNLVGGLVRRELEEEIGPDTPAASDDLDRLVDDPELGLERADEADLRQLLEAKAYRQSRRGEEPIDVEAELARLLGRRRRAPGDPEG